jgi:hypothetical protein
MRTWLYPYWLIVQHDHNLVLLNFLLGNRILKVAKEVVSLVNDRNASWSLYLLPNAALHKMVVVEVKIC